MRRRRCRGGGLRGSLGHVMVGEEVWSDLGGQEGVNAQDWVIESTDSARGASRRGSLLLSYDNQDVHH